MRRCWCPTCTVACRSWTSDNKPIVHLGYDAAWTKLVQSDGALLRDKPQLWQPGRFVHPHHAAFDAEGNIYVVEWVPIGRITFLRHVA